MRKSDFCTSSPDSLPIEPYPNQNSPTDFGEEAGISDDHANSWRFPVLLHVPKPFGYADFPGRWIPPAGFWDRLLAPDLNQHLANGPVFDRFMRGDRLLERKSLS